MSALEPEHPDLLPSADGINQLGLPENPWDIVHANAISDGTRTIQVADLATSDQIGDAVVRSLPAIQAPEDEGKMLMVRNGQWEIVSYPAGALPPVSTDDEGKVLQVEGGQWALKRAMTLPPVDATMDGCTLRVVAGQFVAQRFGDDPAGGTNVYPCPVAPIENDNILISSNNAWITTKLTEKMSVPPMGAQDAGKFLTVVQDTDTGGWKLDYTRPPVVTAAAAGALPPLPGDAKQFFNGAGGWSAVTAGNNGHWRVGDFKLTVRPVEDGWIALDGKRIGKAGSAAEYRGDKYKALYAIIDGTAAWETNWDAGAMVTLQFREYYQVRYAPDAQAPAEMSVLYEAAARTQSHFQLQACRDLSFSAGVRSFGTYPSATGWYRLDGDTPTLLSGGGTNLTGGDGAVGILFDLTGSFSIDPGLWYYRIRQTDGPGASPTWTSRWTYGSVLTTSA